MTPRQRQAKFRRELKYHIICTLIATLLALIIIAICWKALIAPTGRDAYENSKWVTYQSEMDGK